MLARAVERKIELISTDEATRALIEGGDTHENVA